MGSPVTDLFRVVCSFLAFGSALILLADRSMMEDHANTLALSIAQWHLLELLFFPVDRDPFAMQVHHVLVIATETMGWYFLTAPIQQAVMCVAAVPLLTNCFSVARFYFHPIFHEIYYHTFTATKLICIFVHYGILIQSTAWKETMGHGAVIILAAMTLIHLVQLYFVYIITRKRMRMLSVGLHLMLVVVVSPYLWEWMIKKHSTT